jgi:hypothetical protein
MIIGYTCPRCHGREWVYDPPYSVEGLLTLVATPNGPYHCPLCFGHGLIFETKEEVPGEK